MNGPPEPVLSYQVFAALGPGFTLSRRHSYLRASAGFFRADLKACPPTVSRAMAKAAAPAIRNAGAGMDVRTGNFCSHDLRAK